MVDGIEYYASTAVNIPFTFTIVSDCKGGLLHMELEYYR